MNKYIYIIKMFGINIEAYLDENKAKERQAELRAFQTLLMQAAVNGTKEEFPNLNEFYNENLCICIDKVLIREGE